MKRYFITGLLIWVPLGITLWVLVALIGTMDVSLKLLPAHFQPERLIGFYIPGLGAIVTLLIIFFTGVLASNLFGQRMIAWSESLLSRIPVVKSIYSSVKQVSDTLLSSKGVAFRKALLIQYPREGAWTIAFQTGVPGASVQKHLSGEFVSVYVPTTPNPTSGFFLMLPRRDVIELELSVDEALKYIISMGVVAPDDKKRFPPTIAPRLPS